MERAKAAGVKFGRKPVSIDGAAVSRMMRESWSVREMAKALGASPSSVQRKVTELRKGEQT